MSNTQDYWKEQKEHSRLKSEIVAAYLVPWAKIVGRRCEQLQYLDLFSGKGRFDDGKPSTPILILDEVEKLPGLESKLKLFFYESKRDLRDSLAHEIEAHPIHRRLRHAPVVSSEKITVDFADLIARTVQQGTYTFIDPFGYSHLSLDLIDVVTRRWGCDCMFYLSISGLERNIRQQEKRPRIIDFFGERAFQRLHKSLQSGDSDIDVGTQILNEVERALQERHKYYFLRFLVELDNAKRPSHYLVFLSKHHLGFTIMRDIMLKRGQKDEHGIPSLLFSPTRIDDQLSLALITPGDNLGKLAAKVMRDFAGETVLLESMLKRCVAMSYPYSDAHVRKALEYLKSDGKLVVLRDGVIAGAGKPKKGDLVRFTD